MEGFTWRSKCSNIRRGGNNRCSSAPVLISIQKYAAKDNKDQTSIRISLSDEVLDKMRVRKGDALDLGVDCVNYRVAIKRIEEPSSLHLSQHGEKRRGEIKALVRPEFGLKKGVCVSAEPAALCVLKTDYLEVEMPTSWLDAIKPKDKE